MNTWKLLFSLWLTSLYMNSRSTSLQMTQFHSFLWLGNSPLYIGTISFSCIQLSIRIYVAHLSWLLSISLQLTLGYTCLSELWFSQGIDACSLEEKLWQTRSAYILKSRDVTLPTKVRLVKAMVLPVVTSGCECWTIKEAERWRIDAFELWC